MTPDQAIPAAPGDDLQPAERATAETSRFCVEFSWVVVGEFVMTGRGDELALPSAVRSEPGVYRLWIESRGRPEVYIGETVCLRRRAREYRRGDGVSTTKRLHDHLLDALRTGAKVTMWIVTDAHYSRGGRTWLATDLSLEEHRLMIENAALADAFAEELQDDTEDPLTARVLNKLAFDREE